jgi:hypothetical protein
MYSYLRGKIRLIGISGAARSGKDTFAQALTEQFGYEQYSFAEPIYKMLNTLPYLHNLRSEMVGKEIDHRFYNKSPRRMLQTLGTEWGRQHISPDVWIWIMQDKLESKGGNIVRHVISDLRFPNEAEWIRKMGGICIRIEREQRINVITHVSEQGIPDELITSTLTNDSTIEALCSMATMVEGLAEEARQSAA